MSTVKTVVNQDELEAALSGDGVHAESVRQSCYRVAIPEYGIDNPDSYAENKYVSQYCSGGDAPETTVLDGSYESIRVIEALPPEDPENQEYVRDGEYLEEGEPVGVEIANENGEEQLVLRSSVEYADEPHPSSTEQERSSLKQERTPRL